MRGHESAAPWKFMGNRRAKRTVSKLGSYERNTQALVPRISSHKPVLSQTDTICQSHGGFRPPGKFLQTGNQRPHTVGDRKQGSSFDCDGSLNAPSLVLRMRRIFTFPGESVPFGVGPGKVRGREEHSMRKHKGFSLIELLIVVAIILIIAAIAIP